MGWGDEILAAGQAQKIHDDTGLRVGIYDNHRRLRKHPIWDGNPVIVQADHVTSAHHILVSAPNARPYIIYPFTAESGWTFNKDFQASMHVARIYLTDAEKELGIVMRRDGPFVLIEPWSKHANLRWPREHWQKLVCCLVDQGYRVVQHTHSATDYVPDGVHQMHTANFREACGVLNSASLYIRGESGMCHAAAALGIPQVTIWGACMDWTVLGGYARQYLVGTQLPICGRYLPCDHCALVMAGISPAQVLVAAQWQIDLYGKR